jgi:hypothetical protein
MLASIVSIDAAKARSMKAGANGYRAPRGGEWRAQQVIRLRGKE